jgi:hypothetical protein
VIDPGDFAVFTLTGVLAVSALTVVFTVARRIAQGGRRRLAGADPDSGQRALLGQLESDVEALRSEGAAVRRELDEVHNRLDFAERLLAQSKERGLLDAPRERGGE